MVAVPVIEIKTLKAELKERGADRIIDERVHPLDLHRVSSKFEGFTLLPISASYKNNREISGFSTTLHSKMRNPAIEDAAKKKAGKLPPNEWTNVQENANITPDLVEVNKEELEKLKEHLLDISRHSNEPDIEKLEGEKKHLKEKLELLYPQLFPRKRIQGL